MEKMTHEELMKRIETLENENKDLRKRKRYGLVWEEQEEEVEKQLKGNYPVLTEVKSREIVTDKNKPMNLLIEGDNLHTLQTLLYTYRNKLDAIYIDPPYNTGKQDFVYNDKMVDEEDVWRHSKWLSFMDKRLRVARELLLDEGVVFISIDDNEQSQLKLLCDDIFGENNFIANIIRGTGSVRNMSKFYDTRHEYVLVYGKNKTRTLLTGVSRENTNAFKNLDNDKKGAWSSEDITVRGGGYVYDIPSISGNKIFTKRWRFSESDMKNKMNGVPEESFDEIYKKNKIEISKNMIIVGEIIFKGSENTPNKKKYLEKVSKLKVGTLWTEIESQKYANSQLEDILGKSKFDNPKPLKIIKQMFETIPNPNAIILDFFAGSGTTGHAVMELNKEDGGNRQFILCTNNENNICEDVTYERLKRVINGYTTPKGKDVEGLGGNLKYYKTDIVYKTDDVNDMKYELLDKSLDLLSIKENTFELIEDTDMFKLFRGQDKLMGVYLDNYPDYPLLDSIMEKMNEDGIENKLLYVAEGTDIENDEKISELKSTGIEVKKIPNKIMQILEGK